MTRRIAVAALVMGLWVGLVLTPAAQEDAPQTVRVPGDEASIPAAINAVAEGGTVLVAAGTWQANLTVDKSLSIRGLGADPSGVHIVASTQGCPVALIRSNAASPIAVKLANLTLRGASAGNCRDDLSDATVGDGVGVLGTAQVSLSDVVVSGNQNDGLHAQNETTVTAINATFRDNGDAGVLALDEATVEVVRSTLSNNQTQGLGTSSANTVHVISSRIADNGDNGLIAIFSSSVRIVDTELANNGADGLYVRGFSTAEAFGSTLTDNAGHGIRLEEATTVALYRNRIEGNAGTGVLAYRQGCVEDFNPDAAFEGTIQGSGNAIADNAEAGVCPDDLQFLMETVTFGE